MILVSHFVKNCQERHKVTITLIVNDRVSMSIQLSVLYLYLCFCRYLLVGCVNCPPTLAFFPTIFFALTNSNDIIYENARVLKTVFSRGVSVFSATAVFSSCRSNVPFSLYRLLLTIVAISIQFVPSLSFATCFLGLVNRL